MQECTKIISVLDNSWDNLIPTLNTQQDQWTPEWLRQQILQEDFRRRHTGGGAANKTAEGMELQEAAEVEGEGEAEAVGKALAEGKAEVSITRGMGALVAGGVPEWRERAGTARRLDTRGSIKKVQQPQQPHGEVLAGVDATAAWAKASSRSGEADWETWHERLTGLAKAPLALLHMDVVGPTKAPSLSDSRYFLTIVDHHIRVVWVYPLKTKGEVAAAVLKEWMQRAQRESGHKVKVIRTNNGGEFIGADFEAEGARTLLGRAGLPDPFWVTALRQVALVKNRVLATVGDKQWVPYTKWYGSAPAVNMLRAYGCMVVFHVPKKKRGKLEASGRWGVHLGLANDHKGWLIWDLTSQQLTVSRDVKFLESLYYKEWKQQQKKLPTTSLIIEADEVQRPSRQVQVTVLEEEISGVTEDGGEPEVEEQQQQQQQQDAPPRTQRPPDRPRRDVCPLNRLTYPSFGKPKVTLAEAMSGPDAEKWKQKVKEEYNSLLENETWEICEVPLGKKAISSKLISRHKYGPDGELTHYNSRLVAKGFQQTKGKDFDEIFALVGKGTILREQYKQQPEGLDDGSGRVCRLKKAIYGLKQAPRAWYHKLEERLQAGGFKKIECDHSLFLLQEEQFLVLLVYVDDILLFSDTVAAGPGGARTRSTGAAGTSGVGDTTARDPTEPEAAGAGGSCAGGAGAGGAGAGGAGVGGTSARGARAEGAGAIDSGSRGVGGTVRLRPYFLPLLQQSGGLTVYREPASRPVLPVCTARRVPRLRPPPVPGTHAMALRPSSVPLCVPLPAPPESSLPELLDFAAACRLHYATALVAEFAESKSACPPSVGGECALGMDILEDRQEDFECLAAAAPCFTSMLLAPEGDPDAPYIPTPRSYVEATTGPYSSQWQAAMDSEMASWKSTGTYVNEVPPPGVNIVNGMWIFRGVDYFKTFSPTLKMTNLRVLLHVAAQRDYELHSLDFSTVFLQGSLHEEIWLRRPPGFTGSFLAGTQRSLRWPVYGLRQAPRDWHDTLRTTLAALGFAPSTADPSLFLRTDTSLPPFYILFYVDDLVFATADTEALTLVKSELQKRHTCTDLGELRSYLGLQITRDRAQCTITLTQSHMVHQVLQRFGFQFSSPQPTPLSTSHSLSAPPSNESVEPSGPYPELVIASFVFTGHADASWVDNSATQRSSQGYTSMLALAR
ncbi:unnamed protein product, partial [Closterium sp. NIES-53]